MIYALSTIECGILLVIQLESTFYTETIMASNAFALYLQSRNKNHCIICVQLQNELLFLFMSKWPLRLVLDIKVVANGLIFISFWNALFLTRYLPLCFSHISRLVSRRSSAAFRFLGQFFKKWNCWRLPYLISICNSSNITFLALARSFPISHSYSI